MPSPLAHLGAAYVVHRLALRKVEPVGAWERWMHAGVALGFSFAQDLDAVAGVVLRDMGAYHNQFTHSLLFVAGVTAATALACGVFQVRRARHYVGLAAVALSLHAAMDFFTCGRGLMLFWPWTERRFHAPFDIFIGLQWGLGLFSWWHLVSALNELLILAPILVLVHLYLRTKRRAADTPSSC